MAAETAHVIDITAELVGERRQEWRDGHDAGMKRGVTSVLQSPAVEQLALELTLTRATLKAVSDTAMQRERLILHWKTEARWWQEEYGRLSAEYSDFVKQVARLVK